ncbi:hypothetical protein Tco_0232824 [Tanacetum coccineum]
MTVMTFPRSPRLIRATPTHDEEERQDEEDKEEEGLNLRVQTPSHFESTDDETYDEVTQGDSVEGEELDEEETNEEEEVNELYRDVNVNLEERHTEKTDALLAMLYLHMLNPIQDTGQKRQQFYGFTVKGNLARDVLSEDDDKLYTFKEGDYNRLRLQDIEDILLLLIQGKLTNLNIEERLAFLFCGCFTANCLLEHFIRRHVDDLQLGTEMYQKKLNLIKPDMYRSYLKRKTPCIAYSNPKGFIYQNKDQKNRLMRIDDLHNFSDGTLNDEGKSVEYQGSSGLLLQPELWVVEGLTLERCSTFGKKDKLEPSYVGPFEILGWIGPIVRLKIYVLWAEYRKLDWEVLKV